MSTVAIPQCNAQSKITLLDLILEYKLRLLQCTFIIRRGAQHSRRSHILAIGRSNAISMPMMMTLMAFLKVAPAVLSILQ